MKKLCAVVLLFSFHFVVGMDNGDKSVSGAAQAESGLKQLEYPNSDGMHFHIDADALSKHVIPANRVGECAQRMNDMRNLIARSEIVQAALEEFQKVLVKETKPWEDEAHKLKAGLESTIDRHTRLLTQLSRNSAAAAHADRTKLYPYLLKYQDPEFENLMSWDASLREQQEELLRLAGAQLASTLLKHEALEQARKQVVKKYSDMYLHH